MTERGWVRTGRRPQRLEGGRADLLARILAWRAQLDAYEDALDQPHAPCAAELEDLEEQVRIALRTALADPGRLR